MFLAFCFPSRQLFLNLFLVEAFQSGLSILMDGAANTVFVKILLFSDFSKPTCTCVFGFLDMLEYVPIVVVRMLNTILK